MVHEPWVGLAEAVSAVRAELQRAAVDGAGQALRFRTGPVELEFTVDVQWDAEAKVRVLVLPWSAEARAAHTSGSTHRLKLVLQPTGEHGQDVEIAAISTERPA